MDRLVPSGPQRHPWKGHSTQSPNHLAAVADVGAEVLTVRLQHMQLTGLIPVGHQILAEIVQRADLADGKLGRPPDNERAGHLPGERDQHGVASCTRRTDTKYVTV